MISRVPARRRTGSAGCLRLVGALTLLAVMAVPAGAAQAKSVTKTVPSTVVYAHGQNPLKPGNCSAVVFVQWADVPNTVSAKVYYVNRGTEYSKSAPPPFDDAYKLVIDYAVPAGSHWIEISKGWGSGLRPTDCTPQSERQKALISNVARVELTIDEGKAACDAAKAEVTRLTKKIADYTRQLQRARRRGTKASTIERLRNARSGTNRRLTKAKQKVRKVC